VTAFQDHVAVITGASSGIGKAIALALAAKGATLCLVGRSVERLEHVAGLARQGGSQARSYPADLSRDDHISELCGTLRRDARDIDVLVHSAGTISMGHLRHAPVEEFDRQYRVNVRAPFTLTQQLLPMLISRRGQIVFINSSAGIDARSGVGQYAATKHALRAMTDSLRDEVNPDGVRVLSVFLGRTASPMQAAIHHVEGRAYDPDRLVQPQDVAAMVISALSLPRTAEVTNISIRPMQHPREDRV
jgi:NADP-dependent 3-hydroxy acid dehydrogenase YdfG